MSITSMSNRARMAEDLTIQQLQQSIQDGVVPSYIGVPLLKSKVEDAKLLQAAKAAQSMGQQPSVAQQIMSQAQQVSQPAPQMAPQAGVEGLSTNLPASMAGGGIVAFAEGGMYDDDEDSYEERLDAERQAEMDSLMDEYAKTFQGGIGQLPAATAAAPSDREGIAGGDAADFVAKIMHKESRGRRYGRDGELLTSEKGAKGEMQVMPGTSRDPGYGVKSARDDSPDELARVGRDYANALLERYGDPKLAAIAYNMGPGATDKWLAAGADVSKLPKETQGYVKGFSGEDGESEVKQTPYGEQIKKAFGFFPEMLTEGAKKITGYSSLNEPEKPAKSKAKAEAKPAAAPVAPAAPAGNPEYSEDLMRQFDQAGERYMNEREAAANAPLAPQEKQLSKLEQYQEALTKDIGKREENIAKQREQDKYMALLQAGLGMMGGTSQHALANIGAGGQQGIQSLMASNKDRTAEENALLSGKLGLLKLGSAAEQAAEMRKLRGDMQKDVLAQRAATAADTSAARSERLTLAQQKELQDSLENRYAILSKNGLKAAESIFDPVKKKEFLDELDKKISQDKMYRSLHKARWGYMPGDDVGAAPAGAPSVIQGLLDKYSTK